MQENQGKKLSFKKILIEAVFIIVLFIITVYCVLKGEDLNEIMGYIEQTNKWYLLVGLALVLVFICMESVIIHYLMKTLNCKLRMRDCIRYSFVGFFVSAITPSASGGQPAQMYFMKKDGIGLSVSTLVLMVVTIAYKFTLVFLSVIMLCFKPVWAKRIIVFSIVKLGKRGLIKNYQRKVSKALRGIAKYSTGSEYLKGHLHVMLNVLLMTVFQRVMLFLVTYVVYRSFRLSGTTAYEIVMLQTLISLAVDNLPLPGGMGATEWLYQIFFVHIMGNLLIPNLLISRAISYYAQIILGAIVTLISFFLKPKHYEEKILLLKKSGDKSKELSC